MRRGAEAPAEEIAGVLLLDKPEGVSSNRALQRVRRVFGGVRAGHCGTLDPAATGLLPICLGVATRIAGLLTGRRKRYLATIRLGAETDTDDEEGRILFRHSGPFPSEDELRSALSAFQGRIRQVPPLYSALKRGGEPLYRKARRGEVLEVAEREVEVYRLLLLARPSPDRIELDIECGSGFYVRALARDLGRRLGCGAHLAALRRTAVGHFRIEDAVRLDHLEALAAEKGVSSELLLSVSDALPELPHLVLDPDEVHRLLHGRAPARAWAGDALEALAVDARGRALALLERADGAVRIRRLLAETESGGCRRSLSASPLER